MLYGEIIRQHLKLINEHIVADTIDYLEARFAFSKDWDGLEKWVHFAKDGEVYDIRLTDDCVRKEDHLNLSAGIWKVYLHGNEFLNGKVVERITTNTAILKVEPTGALNGEPFPEMPASVTEQILARLDEVEQNGGGTGDGYSPAAKVERVEGGVRVTITDKDGTTSEVVQDGKSGVHVGSDAPPAGTRVWVNPDGKGTEIPKVDDTLTKPGYAADAAKVGEKIEQLSGDIDDKLDADKLPEAINIALTQAKESGEFKGDPGQPGAPGNDYVLTEADKTEIAEIAAGMVDVPEGGGGTSFEIDSTLTQAGKAADAKVVGDKLGEVSKAKADKSEIPIVADWALAELPFTEAQISNTVSGAGFVVNPTNFADGKTYFRYHAGASYGFRWTNPNPQKGSLTITMRGYSQYSSSLSTKIVTVYTDGTDNSLTNMMYLKHGETVTYTTDPNKTVDYIRGNYDFEDWVLLDMDVLSIVADYPAPTGTVKSVNGVLPDDSGNVEIDIPEGGSGAASDGWTKIGEVTFTGKLLPITAVADGVITVDITDGIPPTASYNNGHVLHNSDYSKWLTRRIIATDTEGQYTLANIDGNAQTPGEEILDYVIELPDAKSAEIKIDGSYKYLKMRITAPAILFHGTRTALQISSYSEFTINSALSSANGKTIEYTCETSECPIDGYMYLDRVCTVGSIATNAAYNEAVMKPYKAVPGEFKISHFNGLTAIGTRVELWGR